MQPNTYYVNPANITLDPNYRPPKKFPLKSVLLTLLFLALLGLSAYLLIDKFFLSTPSSNEHQTTTLPVSLSTPLSSIDSSAEGAITNALAGRLFTIDHHYDQSLFFTDASHYTFSYYRDPTADRNLLPASTESGTYTLSGQNLILSSGDSFTITGDYLVKTADKLSKNQNAVYFDSHQLPTFTKALTAAIEDRTAKQLLSNTATTDQNFKKARLNAFSCAIDRAHQTSADHYVCTTSYTRFFASASDEQKTSFIIRLNTNNTNNPVQISGEY